MSVRPTAALQNPKLVRPETWKSIPRPDDLLWLDKNENLDPALLAFTGRLLHDLDPLHLATYPEPAALYEKLARWVGVSPDALVLTPGSDGAIRLTFEAFVNEGDVVVHTAPTFAMYPVYSQMFGAQPKPIAYERGETGPQLTAEQIRTHLSNTKPRLFCLPNPDSPTGTVLPPDELRSIVDLCGELETVALIDEAYHPFYEPSCVAWTKECPHLIVARTFSKAWGLAGLRVGYAVGHPETIAYYHKLRPMYELGELSTAFIDRMLDHVDEMEASVRRLLEGKQHLASEAAEMGFEVLPTQGNFQHIAFGDQAEAVHNRLKDIALYRRDFNDACLAGFSRFSVSTKQGLEPIIEAIREATQ